MAIGDVTMASAGVALTTCLLPVFMLAAIIRETGLLVYGFGEKKLPPLSFPPATSSFIRRFCVPRLMKIVPLPRNLLTN